VTHVGVTRSVLGMPWMETDVRTQRVKFCLEREAGGWTMGELCACFGISRRTGYKWLARYAAGGLDALGDRCRAPQEHPNRTPDETEQLILELRRSRPSWGSKKLVARLRTLHPDLHLPARSTVDEILRRSGLVPKRRLRRHATPTPRAAITQATAPNEVWSVDFKGHFPLGDGSRCEPFTLADQCSRFSLSCRALVTPRFLDTKACFVSAFAEFGLPTVILSDNGGPFSSNGIAGLSRLSIWWLKLGIRPERIEPGHPQQNGKHERFHRTLKDETANPPKYSRAAQQRAFNRFRREYNEERPHEALGMRTPAELYTPSKREYTGKEPERFDYPSSFEVRRVQENGNFKWKGSRAFVSETLAGEDIGMEPVGNGIWDIHLGPLRIAMFNESDLRVLRLHEVTVHDVPGHARDT
jgi:transposase InsO family protein